MYVDSSTNSMVEAVEKPGKSAELKAHSLMLMTKRNAELQAANEAAMRHKSHKGKRVQREVTLTANEVMRLTTLKESREGSDGKKAKKRARVEVGGLSQQRRCGEAGHVHVRKQEVEVDYE